MNIICKRIILDIMKEHAHRLNHISCTLHYISIQRVRAGSNSIGNPQHIQLLSTLDEKVQGNFSDVIGHLYHTNCTYIEMASYRSTSFAGFDSTESRQCTRTYTWALPGTVAATQGRSSIIALTIRPPLMVMFQELTRTLKNFHKKQCDSVMN